MSWPARFSEDRFAYSNVASGDFDAFWGLEHIAYGGETVYELRYSGGFLR